jgi:TRAP-type mannitol/chloroaromatic compound transport system permease small subunit
MARRPVLCRDIHTVSRFLLFVDTLSTWVGKCAGWLILALTLAVSYEVFVRYLLGAPTTWAYDVSYMMYGGLFLLAGAYTLARNGHVRGDMLYRLWKPRTQAVMDLVLYVLFFFPGMLALIYAGYEFARMSWMFQEKSIFSPAGAPIFPLKTLIPLTGLLLLLQGVAEVMRCILCIRNGVWPRRLHDVEETETVILHEREYAARRGTPTGAAQ